MIKGIVALFFCFSALLGATGTPIRLGTAGPTYEIKEGDMYQAILDKGRELNSTRLQRKLEEKLAEAYRVDIGLPECAQTKERLLDPGFVAPDDVFVRGVKVVSRGDYVNPLLRAPLPEPLLVVNLERCEEQRFWQSVRDKSMTLVAKGDLSRIAFSQYDVSTAPMALMRRYGVTCTPATLTQKGRYLVLHEYGPEEVRDEACEQGGKQ